MAEISKISGVAIADVAKVDAILKADIANINGLTVPSAAAFLLDTYTGAAAAYSVRRLNSLYTGACMRVREDGTNTETDIGFDANGDLDTAAIATHCGANNGYVKTWYDQSQSGGTGSGKDAVQATAANQPQIYNGASVITENGKPAVDLDADKRMTMALVSSSTTATVIAVHNTPSGSDYCALFANGLSNGYALTCKNTKYNLFYRGVADYYPTSTRNIQQSLIFAFTQSATSHKLFADGTSIQDITPGTMGTPTSASSIGKYDNGSNGTARGTIQEIVVYGSDQTSNRSGIESNLNTYFSIY